MSSKSRLDRAYREITTVNFNDGSCVHTRCITGIEIENGKLSLIKWLTVTNEDGILQIVRVLLEGPKKLKDDKTN